MLQIPFRKFAQRKYLHYARDVSKVRFDKRLWNCFGERDLGRLKEIADLNIQTYFNSK
jgi:hypothetical protein